VHLKEESDKILPHSSPN